MEKKKRFTEVWEEDHQEALLIKVKTRAKNLPEVWSQAMQLLKQEVDKNAGSIN